MESCAPLAEGREGRRLDGCPNDRSVFGVKNAALNLKCTAATGKRNAYQQNGETCAYPKPKSGRIDDEALPELRWLRRGRASASAENRDRALACPLQYGQTPFSSGYSPTVPETIAPPPADTHPSL